MDLQNLAYALVQVVHNFGAVAVLGGAYMGRWSSHHHPGEQRPFAWLVLLAWLMQGMSGAGFGAVSYYYYGQFPDIFGVAVVALVLKMACTVGGILFSGAYLCCGHRWHAAWQNHLWNALFLLGVIALGAAAFLRWYA